MSKAIVSVKVIAPPFREATQPPFCLLREHITTRINIASTVQTPQSWRFHTLGRLL